jgi:VanZ family protein
MPPVLKHQPPKILMESRERMHWFGWVCWLGVVIWTCTVFYLSSLAGPEVADMNVFNVNDKALHFVAFFSGVLALVPALRHTWRWPWKKCCIVAVIILSTYGALDEVHQKFTPSRSALDVWDWLADTLGACAGAPLAAVVHAAISRRTQRG